MSKDVFGCFSEVKNYTLRLEWGWMGLKPGNMTSGHSYERYAYGPSLSWHLRLKEGEKADSHGIKKRLRGELI